MQSFLSCQNTFIKPVLTKKNTAFGPIFNRSFLNGKFPLSGVLTPSLREGVNKIIPSQMEVAPLHCTVDITQKRRLFKNTKEIEKM